MTSFYEDFFGHFFESSPPTNTLAGDLIDFRGPPPPIPFNTRPVRGPPPPIHRSTRPSPVPSPDPLPVFTPSLVSLAGFTGTMDLAPMGSPTWQHLVGRFSLASSISSTATSNFSITQPGLMGRIPPIPQPFAGAGRGQVFGLNQPQQAGQANPIAQGAWFNQPLQDDLDEHAVLQALAQGQQQNDAILQNMANLLAGLNQFVQNPPAPAPINVPAPQIIQPGGQALAPTIKKIHRHTRRI